MHELLRCAVRPALRNLPEAGLPPLRDGGFGGDHTSPAEVKPRFLPDRGLSDALLAFEGLQRGRSGRDNGENGVLLGAGIGAMKAEMGQERELQACG